jgi:transposase-like protein
VTSRTYSPDEKATALNLYVTHGLAETWRLTGIPKPTIASWVTRAGLPHTDSTIKTRAATEAAASRAEQLRADLRVALLEKATDLLQRMDAPHIEFKGKDADQVEYPIAPAGAVQNYATSVGILIDKYRLEMGEPTSRSESRALSDDIEPLDDHERLALREAIDRELAHRTSRSGTS